MHRRSSRIVLLGLLMAVASAQAQECPEFGASGQLPILVNAKLEPRTKLLCNDGFAVLHSGLAHEPLWSAEHLTEEDLERGARLGRATKFFHPDLRITETDRAELSDYRGSGWDRGHLTPSGEASDARAQEQTFSLANVVPQTPALNEGIWTGVEMATRDLARQDGEVYVVTGPAFGSDVQAIGSHDVLIPYATWKAVYDPAANEAGVYFCRNNDAPTCTVISVAALVSEIGIDPFPGLPAPVKDVAMTLPAPRKSPYQPRSAHTRTGSHTW